MAAAPDGETQITIDVPSGRVVARVRRAGGTVEAVTFRNVPSYVLARACSRRSRTVAPGISGAPAVTMRNGSPAVW